MQTTWRGSFFRRRRGRLRALGRRRPRRPHTPRARGPPPSGARGRRARLRSGRRARRRAPSQARSHQARARKRARAAGRVSVEGRAGPGHLRGQGEAVARPHAPVRELPGRTREDPPARRPDRQLRLHRGGERARIARAGEEPHQPACAVLQRRLQRRQVLPLHRAHEGRRVPRHQVHAGEAPARHALLRPLHRQPRCPRDGGHRPARGAAVRFVVRRLAAAETPPREGSAGPHGARRAPVLRRARGPRPGCVLRAHRARRVQGERQAHRALPVGPASRVRRRADRRDARGGRRARLRARRPHQGPHRHDQRPRRQAACRVRAQPRRRRGGPFPRGDGGGRARVHGA